MLKIENWEVNGWAPAIRGMRNPMNSWDQSDSGWDGDIYDENGNLASIVVDYDFDREYHIGPVDQQVMMKLRNAGPDHRKFMRMIVVYLDITAPLYWWKEFKTYRLGRKFGDPEPDIIDPEMFEYEIEMNSCSTMHKVTAKKFELDDFSHEHLNADSIYTLELVIKELNRNRLEFINFDETDSVRVDLCGENKKDYWWQIIQLLPTSYNQRRTIMISYETLMNIYKSRRYHKLDEWHVVCDMIEHLPFAELITGKKG